MINHCDLPANLSPFAFIAPQVTLKSNINPLTLRTSASFATFCSNPLCFLLFTSGTRPVFYFLNIGQRNQSRDPFPVVHHNEGRHRRAFLFGHWRKVDKIGMVDWEARTRSVD